MTSRLHERTALVTGASRGIGRAIARRMALDGAWVAVHYGHDDAAAAQTVREIEQAGGQAVAVRCELGRHDDADRLFGTLEPLLPGGRLDILINNAGGNLGTGAIETTTVDEFDRIVARNAHTPYFLIQRALPLLRDGGRIINISSTDTRIAITSELAYSMAKGALNVLGRTLALALGDRGITVNTVAPGITETDQNAWLHASAEIRAASASATALNRIGQPDDIADIVAFLASDDARWITGHLVDATGGTYLGPRMATPAVH